MSASGIRRLSGSSWLPGGRKGGPNDRRRFTETQSNAGLTAPSLNSAIPTLIRGITTHASPRVVVSPSQLSGNAVVHWLCDLMLYIGRGTPGVGLDDTFSPHLC